MTTPKKQRKHHRPPGERDRAALTVDQLSPESRRQLEDSIREMERGEEPVPVRDVLREIREGSTR